MSDNLNIRKLELVKRLIEDEEEDDEIMVLLLSKRNKIDSLYTSRIVEGSYQILIKGHLNVKENKFRSYCRLNKTQFQLSLIKSDIQPIKKDQSQPRKNYFSL